MRIPQGGEKASELMRGFPGLKSFQAGEWG